MTTLILVAAALVAAALTAYALVPLFRPAAPGAVVERAELEEERDALYAAILELDRDHKNGVVHDDDYRRVRARDEARAALVLARLESLPPAPRAAEPGRRAPGWPLAVTALAALIAGAAVANAYLVPPLQALSMPADEAKAVAAARRLPGLERELNAQAAVSADGSPRIDTLLEYGDAAWQAQDYERAASAYSSVLRRDPKQPVAVGRYGTLLFFSGRNDEALELLDLAVKLDPTQTEFYITKGNLLFAEKKPAEAIDAWEAYQRHGGSSARVADLIAAARKNLEASDPGAKLFAQNCAGCHGSEGQGIVGPALRGNARATQSDFVRARVRNGTGDGRMPAFPKLSAADLDTLAKFVARLGTSEPAR